MHMKTGYVTLGVTAALVAATACSGPMTTDETTSTPLPALSSVTQEQWAALAQRKIFFGHQSVGGNIMDGLQEVLAEHSQVRLNIVESRDLASRKEPGLYHALVGRNDYPIEKFDDFVALSSSGFDGGGVAMVKLCYTDMHKDTDPRALFQDYQRRVAALRQRNPDLTVVHFTTPLTNIENWKGQLMSSLRGFSTQRERNLIRHRYNELMRAAYHGKEPLFDIAALESTLPDGRAVYYRKGGENVPLLAAAYTDDGGHLNAVARRRVAEQLLVMLATLEDRKATSVASAGSP